MGDLVETVCDMVGEELGLNEDQVEGLIREIRAEKYFEAHGIRTPLPPSRPPAPAAPPVAPVPTAAPTPAPVPSVKPTDAGEFEFIDDDVDMGPVANAGGADTDDDAATEASDCMSDVTEEDQPKSSQNPMAFDDI